MPTLHPLWRYRTTGMLRAAARLLGTTGFRFALHGRQRTSFSKKPLPKVSGKVFRKVSKEVSKKVSICFLFNQMEKRFGTLPDPVAQRLQNATTDKLERWALNLLDAQSLDDVFR